MLHGSVVWPKTDVTKHKQRWYSISANECFRIKGLEPTWMRRWLSPWCSFGWTKSTSSSSCSPLKCFRWVVPSFLTHPNIISLMMSPIIFHDISTSHQHPFSHHFPIISHQSKYNYQLFPSHQIVQKISPGYSGLPSKCGKSNMCRSFFLTKPGDFHIYFQLPQGYPLVV